MTTDSNIDQIHKKIISTGILDYEDFSKYKDSLIEKLTKREPGINPNKFENVFPEIYINYPIKLIPLVKIKNIPPQAIIQKRGLEQFAEMKIEPDQGAFHGARLGREVYIPISVVANKDGTFSINDGMHRVSQAVISGNDTILAFVEDGNGPTLRDIFNSIKKQ